jgi:hypothetical protein
MTALHFVELEKNNMDSLKICGTENGKNTHLSVVFQV